MKKGGFRQIVLTFHLYAGLSAALVLFVIGITGAGLAFRDDYVRWANPGFWTVKPGAQPMREDALIAAVEAAYSPARVTSIYVSEADGMQFFILDKRGPVFVNRYDGRIFDARPGESILSKFVIYTFQLHTRLAAGVAGRIAVDIATFEAMLLVPSGFVLWWRVKRKSLKWKTSWNRFFWDLHNCVGLFGGTLVFFLVLTGSLHALKLSNGLFAAFNPQLTLTEPGSTLPGDSANRQPVSVDTVLAAAVAVLPDARPLQVDIPSAPQAPFVVRMRANDWAMKGPRSTVYADQYTGAILRVDDARDYSFLYRAYQLGKKLHTGELFGPALKGVLALSSLFMAVSAFTGFAIGIRKVAARWRMSRIPRPARKEDCEL